MSQLHLKNIEIEELETKLLEEEAKNKKLQENVKVNHKVSVSVQTKKSYSKQIENSVTQMNTSSAISNNETIIMKNRFPRIAQGSLRPFIIMIYGLILPSTARIQCIKG